MVDERRHPAKGPRKTGMFFSGGVDSFYTLWANREQIDALVFVVGFDTRLHDARHIARCLENAQAVAVAYGKELVVLRSNIRSHHIFGRHNWGRSYGGALAAVAHLLGTHYEAQLVSAGYYRGNSFPCGSHWKTDRYQSSADVRLLHYGDRHSRWAKVAAVCHDPVVQQHLRVCWQRRRDGVNCSLCEKCLRTMSALYSCGKLEQCVTFDRSLALPRCIDELRDPMPIVMQHSWVEIFRRTADRELRNAIRSYALRSAAQHMRTPMPRFRRAPFRHVCAHWQKWRLRWAFRLP